MLTLLRTLIGAVILSLLWASFVLLCSSRTDVALAAFLSTFFLLPVIIPMGLFLGFRLSRKIQNVAWSGVPRLRSQVLRRVLEGADSPLRLMSIKLDADDQSFFYFALPSWRQGRIDIQRVLLVSDSWLKAWEHKDGGNSEPMESELDFVLSRINEDQWPLMRTLQMSLWIGQIFVLDLALRLLGILFRILGFQQMPSPVFFCQNLAWSLRGLWFSREGDRARFWDTRGLTPRVSEPPASWNSLCFGVWGLYPVRHLHPSWRFFVDSEGIIPSTSSQK